MSAYSSDNPTRLLGAGNKKLRLCLQLCFCAGALNHTSSLTHKPSQGITKANEHVEDPLQMIRLWTHEVLRVFYDRLVDDDDRQWVGHHLSEIIKLHFKEKPERVFSQDKLDDNNLLSALRALMFGDFMVQGQDKIYTQIMDQTAMAAVVNEYLSDFNATSKKPMHLVIFQFALEHVARIARIIQLPGGNALLVGMGGAGRQSLTRLAAYMEIKKHCTVCMLAMYMETRVSLLASA
eukprot:scaffold77290_cov15-Tisochrysis_lutea.AAC.1